MVPFGAFSKTKTCFLQFTVRDENKNELAEIRTNVFKVIATPDILVKASPVPKKISEGESYDINIQATNNTPQFPGKYQLRVYRRLPNGTSKLEIEKNLANLTTVNVPYKLKVTSEIAKEAYLKIRAQVLYKSRVVGEYETPNIPVAQKEETETKPAKPEIHVVTKLPQKTQPPPLTKGTETKLPPKTPAQVPPKVIPQPQIKTQHQKIGQAVRAKPKSLKLKVVTPTVKPTSKKRERVEKNAVKTAASKVSRKTSTKARTITTRKSTAKPIVKTKETVSQKIPSKTIVEKEKVDKFSAGRIMKPEPTVTERGETSYQRVSKVSEATNVAHMPVASKPVTAKRVRESKAVEVSVAEPPKVSLYFYAKEKELVLGSDCGFDIEVRNLNLEMAGIYWLNIYYCPVSGEEVLVEHIMFKLQDKKKISYRFNMKDLPKSKRFKLRAEVLYQGIVIGKVDSGEVLVKSPSINKMLKLSGVLNVPSTVISGGRIIPLLEIDAKYVIDPVTLSVNLTVSSGEKDIQKEFYSYTLGEDGTYLLPVPIRLRDIPPNVKRASLKLNLSVGDVKIGSKETSFQVAPQKSPIDVTPPLLQESVKAGETAKYLLRISQ
jgi:hypothetical protein